MTVEWFKPEFHKFLYAQYLSVFEQSLINLLIPKLLIFVSRDFSIGIEFFNDARVQALLMEGRFELSYRMYPSRVDLNLFSNSQQSDIYSELILWLLIKSSNQIL